VLVGLCLMSLLNCACKIVCMLLTLSFVFVVLCVNKFVFEIYDNHVYLSSYPIIAIFLSCWQMLFTFGTNNEAL